MAANKPSARHCSVPGCVTDNRYDENIILHTKIKDKNIRNQWNIKMRRDKNPFFKVRSTFTSISGTFATLVIYMYI